MEGRNNQQKPPPASAGTNKANSDDQKVNTSNDDNDDDMIITSNNSPATEKKKRKRKPPLVPWKKPADMPRRPLSAYNLFFKERREAMMMMQQTTKSITTDKRPVTEAEAALIANRKKSKSVGIGFANLARTIASEWKDLDPNTKAPFEARAATDKERYDKEMLVWRAKQKKENEMAAATSGAAAGTSGTDKGNNSIRSNCSSSSSNNNNNNIGGLDGQDLSTMGSSRAWDAASAAAVMSQSLQGTIPNPSLPTNPTSTLMANMMMMGHPATGFHMQVQQQTQQQLTFLPSDCWTNVAATTTSAMHRSELTSAAIRNMSPHQHQEHQRGSPFQPHQQGPLGRHPFMSFGSDATAAQASNRLFGTFPRNRNMAGAFDEYQHQSHVLSGGMGSTTATPPNELYMMFNNSAPAITMFDPQELMQDEEPSMDDRHLHHRRKRGCLERRNTWSGMSEAQQNSFQQQLQKLQYDEERLKEQLQEEHLQQLQLRRRVHNKQDAMSNSERSHRFAAVSVGVGSRPSWGNATAEVPRQASTSLSKNDDPPALQRQQQPSSVGLFPDTWFEADDQNMEDSNHVIDDEPIRYSPADGDLNEKLPGKANPIPTSSFGTGYQVANELKLGKKSSSPSHSPSYDPWKQQNPDPAMDMNNNDERVGPSSLHTLGMRLDEESVDFLSKLRFGDSNTPSADD